MKLSVGKCVVAVGALLAVVSVAGCGGTAPGATTAATSNGIRLITATASSDASEQARFDGKTALEKGCIYGYSASGEQPTLLIFPQGSSLTGQSVTLPSTKAFQVGGTAAFGGGFHPNEKYPDELKSCPANSVFVISSVL